MQDEAAPSQYARYRHLAIEGAGPEPSPEDFAAIEAVIGTELPEAFRDFMRVASGGYVEYVIPVRFRDGTTELMEFSSIYSVRSDDAGNIIERIDGVQAEIDTPTEVLPFAEEGSGSIALLDLTAEGKGRVVAWVLGMPAWTGLHEEEEFVELARSFDDYVAQLRINRDEIIDELTSGDSTQADIAATERFLDVAIPSWRSDDEFSNAVATARRLAAGEP